MNDLEKYEKGLFIEHELINRRLTCLLFSQTILFAALAFVLGKDVTEKQSAQQVPQVSPALFFDVVFLLGMGISLAIFVGVCMAIVAKVVL